MGFADHEIKPDDPIGYGFQAQDQFSDTVDLQHETRGIYIGNTGNLKCTLREMADDDFVTFHNIQDGTFLPLRIKRIHTDSTVTAVVGCY